VNVPPGLDPTVNKDAEATVKTESGWSDMDRYGFNGLLSLIRGETSDLNTVALGTDVSFLGLDLSAKSDGVKLSKTFASPWVETSRSEVEPQFTTPEEFKLEEVPKIEEKLSLFTDETLFYIFYTRPKDVLQELSARELMNRNWRYHKELTVWLTKDQSVEPIQQGPQCERGIYIFFDPHNWEKVRKEFILYYQSIMA
jgi:CCR4-NOT transcription complex subunit 2